MDEPCLLVSPPFPGLQRSSLCRQKERERVPVLSCLHSHPGLEGGGLGEALSVSVCRRIEEWGLLHQVCWCGLGCCLEEAGPGILHPYHSQIMDQNPWATFASCLSLTHAYRC